MTILKKLYFWIVDYVYVVRKEIRSIFVQSDPSTLRRTGQRVLVLIPGVYENWRFMEPIAERLFADGYDVHVLPTLGFNSGTIESMAELVVSYIHENKLSDVMIVAHSKGGLVGKYAMTMIDDLTSIRQMIAINTPFSGSKYAYFLPVRSLRIFIPKSKILTKLAENLIVNSRITSIYSDFDPHIPGGSQLEGATNIKLKHMYGHFRILEAAEFMKELNRILNLQPTVTE